MMQCHFDQPLSKSLEPLSYIWFFLRSGFPWIIRHQHNDLFLNVSQWPVNKTHQVVWDSLLDYDRLDWQWTFMDLKNTPGVAYENVLNFLTRFGVSKVLILLVSIKWLL